jgi:hypothetical protein
MRMKVLPVISLVLVLFGVGISVLACGGVRPAPPAGAASGLNTFIFVYSEN